MDSRIFDLRLEIGAALFDLFMVINNRLAMHDGPIKHECMVSTSVVGRSRVRDAGVIVGSMSPGPLNAITDVAGVRVGQTTLCEGDSTRTGVTAILPHSGNVFKERVPAGIHVGNGFGKLTGVTQVRELGELETPVLLTGTLCTWMVADALAEWMLTQPGMEKVCSINPVVGETNDGFLSNNRLRPVRSVHVKNALESAAGGVIAEGAVGAGTGTVAFGWKGGIGTSSRKLPGTPGHIVGVLVQTNFDGQLTIAGMPIGLEPSPPKQNLGDGSIMVVIATDAPLCARNLERLAARSMFGLARTGSNMANGSGDYAIAFSTAKECRRRTGESLHHVTELPNEAMSPLFQAVAEATEEAIYNSLFQATTVSGFQGTIEALPLDRVLKILG